MQNGSPTTGLKIVLVVIGIALLSAGPAALLAPESAAAAYGIAVDSPGAEAYLLASGIRDVALGVWLLALVGLGANRRLLAVSLLAIAVVAAGDALVVLLHSGGNGTPALFVHFAGLALLLLLVWLLWRHRAMAGRAT